MKYFAFVLTMLMFASNVIGAEFWLTSDPSGARESVIDIRIDEGPVNIYAIVDQNGDGGETSVLQMWSGIDPGGIVKFTDINVIEGLPIVADITALSAVYGATDLATRPEPYPFAVLEVTPMAVGFTGIFSMPMKSLPGGVAISGEPMIIVRKALPVPEPRTLGLLFIGIVLFGYATRIVR